MVQTHGSTGDETSTSRPSLASSVSIPLKLKPRHQSHAFETSRNAIDIRAAQSTLPTDLPVQSVRSTSSIVSATIMAPGSTSRISHHPPSSVSSGAVSQAATNAQLPREVAWTSISEEEKTAVANITHSPGGVSGSFYLNGTYNVNEVRMNESEIHSIEDAIIKPPTGSARINLTSAETQFIPSSFPDIQSYYSLCNNSEFLYPLDNYNLTWFNCTGNDSSRNDADGMYKHPILGGLLSVFALVTIVGNFLVIAAVARERYLRTVTNYFIVSLALADLIIGAVVMPFSIFLEITNNVWIFGTDWCDVWHSIDVLASTASILNLSVISLDRYWAITDPIAYPSKMSTARSFVLMALVWICSAAISFPAIIWWRSVLTEPLRPHVCSFTEDTGYLIFSSFISFYFPISIILFAYYKIYLAATEQTRSLKTGSKVMATDGLNGEVMTLRMHRGGGRDSTDASTLHYSRAAANSDSDDSPTHTTHQLATGVRPSRMISRKWKHFAISKKLSKLAKEQKAAKTLGIVMGVFCICWVPFFIANVLYGICGIDCVPRAEIVFPVFTWLGYINSGMNPVIYAFSMRDFRRAFIRILCCFCPGYIRFRARKRYIDTNYSLSTSSYAVNYAGEPRNSKCRL